jgi:hypothetical protein
MSKKKIRKIFAVPELKQPPPHGIQSFVRNDIGAAETFAVPTLRARG